MKKIICLISLIVVEYLFADVLSYRYDDGKIHYGLPSWISLFDYAINLGPKDKLPDIYTLSDERMFFTTNNGKAIVDFSDNFSIEILGNQYTSIVVDKDGRIVFGNGQNDYVKQPYIKLAGDKIFLGESFEWGVVSQKIDNKRENILVLSFGPLNQHLNYLKRYRNYSIQVLMYPDGEIQVQYWILDDLKNRVEGWMRPTFFDGYIEKKASLTDDGSSVEYINTDGLYIDVYGSEGLRSGWIAKAMRPEYAVNITEPQKGSGLLVRMESIGEDFGGIIAYDYSREHPVVGSISSIEILASNLPTKSISPLYCWYFDEYYNTNLAHYEKWLSKDISEITLTKENFGYTWNAYKTNPDNKSITIRNDETIDFVGAPAFKFQRIGVGYLSEYEFCINRIRYFLAQPKSVQFLPQRNKHHLFVENSAGGIVEFSGLKGAVDATNSYRKVYDIYPGFFLTGSISASPGYFIDRIIVAPENDEKNAVIVYEDDKLILQNVMDFGFSITKNKQEVWISGKMLDHSNLILKVLYKKCVDRELSPVVPAMVKTETYTALQSSPENRIFSSAKIMDAFGGVAQKQKKVHDDEFAVSSEYSNSMGQTTRVPMTFVHKSQSGDFEYVDMACEGCITEANAYYYKRSESDNLQNQVPTDDDVDRPDAENNAFTELKYFNGNPERNGAVSASAGIAKRAFVFNDDNYAQEWEMPAKTMYDFVPYDKLNKTSLVDVYSKKNDGSRHDYVLKIHRNAEGKYTQDVYDSKGRKLSSWFFDGKDEQVVAYEYDEFDNLTKTYNTKYSDLASYTTYDAQGRVVSIQSNDRGLTQNRYDAKGRLRFVKTPLHKDDEFASYFFDELGRTIAIGEVFGMSPNDFNNPDIVIPESHIKYLTKTIYGKPSVESLVSLGVEQSLALSILSQMKNIRSNDVGAVITFDEKGRMISVKLSEYNRIGEQICRWMVVGLAGVPAVQLGYEYNLSSELIRSTFSEWEGSKWKVITTRTRDYDNQGRLVKTMENGDLLAEYKYTPNGNVREKLYYDKNILVFRKVISRDVYDRPTKIAYYDSKVGGKEIYSTILDFKSVQTNQVEKNLHNWRSVKNSGDFTKENIYDYDYSGRLTSVSGDMPGFYDYDDLGRMTKKNEGETSINYLYSPLFYRPAGMSINNDSPSALGVYIQYDAAGNIWYDLHNQLVYKNGKNNMPVKVYKFSTMPENITLKEVNNESQVLNTATEIIDIAYDGSDRIWYSYDNLSKGTGFTRVTLPGVGVYETSRNNGVDGKFKLIRQDLVAGAYRDEGDIAHFPVLDAQGNVRGYATSEGLKSAYDYYAYGTMKDLAPNAGDDNKRWQDKEFDGEHGKYYFGSRYFDPFFGMWMSPDPAGQFANPYSYGGDPVNFVDPNGEFAFIPVLVAAAVGAIIGGATSWYHCEKNNHDNCGGALGKGAAIGGVSGFFGGAAGGAAAGLGSMASGAIGGAASSTAGYMTSSWVNDQRITWSGVGSSAASGAGKGLFNGVSNAAMSGDMLLNHFTSLRDAVSSSFSSMVVAGFNGKNVGNAAKYAFWGSFASSGLHSGLDAGLTNLVGFLGGEKALNFLYNLGPDGRWKREGEAVEYMKDHPGTVSASVAGLDGGLAIATVFGAGPFSHVRASDKNGDVVENNLTNGVIEYYDKDETGHYVYKDMNENRWTYVTDRYIGGQNNGVTVQSMKDQKMDYWAPGPFLGMCVGAAGLVNSKYKAGAPNNFLPWIYRNYWSY